MTVLQKILRGLFRDALGRDIFTLASGNAVAQVLQMVAAPFLMLLYAPSDYGTYAVYLAAVGVLAVVSALRYDFAILVATNQRTVFSLLTLCAVMVGTWCVSLAILVTVALSLNSSYPLPDILLTLLPFMPLGVGLEALYTVSFQYATRNEKYGTLRTARIVYGFVTLLGQAALFFVFRSPVGLIVGESIGRFAGVLVLSSLVIVDWRSCATRVSMRSVAVAARRHSRFPRYLVATDLLSTVSRNAPVTLFAIFLGVAFAGVFGQAQRLCGAPLSLIAQAVGRVFVGRMSSTLRNKVGDIADTFRDLTMRLLVMGSVALSAIIIMSAVLPLVLGDEWERLTPVLLVLSPSFFALFVVSPLAPTLTVLNRQRMQLLWEIGRLGAVAVSILAGVGAGLDFEVIVLCYSLVLVVCLAALYILCKRTIEASAAE